MTIDEITDNFALLDDWDDRYRYFIELGTHVQRDGDAGPVLTFDGDSDAHIVRGLIAILFAIYSGKPAREIASTDAIDVFNQIGLREHLTPQRSKGFRSMVERIKTDARSALARES